MPKWAKIISIGMLHVNSSRPIRIVKAQKMLSLYKTWLQINYLFEKNLSFWCTPTEAKTELLPGTNDENDSDESQKSFLIKKYQIIAAYWMLLTEANGCRAGMESDEMGYGK